MKPSEILYKAQQRLISEEAAKTIDVLKMDLAQANMYCADAEKRAEAAERQAAAMRMELERMLDKRSQLSCLVKDERCYDPVCCAEGRVRALVRDSDAGADLFTEEQVREVARQCLRAGFNADLFGLSEGHDFKEDETVNAIIDRVRDGGG